MRWFPRKARARWGRLRAGPGDGISIAVLDNPELETQQRVGQQETIRFPFVGDIAIAGLSEGEDVACAGFVDGDRLSG